MADQFITCPKCNAKIPLNEALMHPIEDKLRREFESAQKASEVAHEKALKSQQEDFDAKLEKERAHLEAQAKKRAEQSLLLEMKDLREQLAEQKEQRDELVKKELKLHKRVREAEEKQQAAEIENARKLDAERQKIREEAAAKVAEEHKLKDREKDLQMEGLKKQIDDWRRKAEQGSQQLQGEAQEQELEQALRATFPMDEIVPIKQGQRGADILQKVRDSGGRECGAILWESKRVKNWGSDWIQKLKDDQREVHADVAVLVSGTLPDSVKQFGFMDGAWVSSFACFAGLAFSLRENLKQVTQVKRAMVGKNENMEALFSYVSGSQFRGRVEAVVEVFQTMQTELNKEKVALQNQWARREKQIEKLITNMVGMYGDLQGIAPIPQIKQLELSSGTSEDGAANAEKDGDY